jgi:hypothetical protein
MAHHYSPKVPHDGLILAFDAANPKCYPGSGTDIYDLSGRNNHGVLQNGASYSSNDVGYINLDGSDDRISITDNNGDFDFAGDNFSINIWMQQQTDTTYPHLYAFNDQYNFCLKAIRGGVSNEYRLYVYQGYSVMFENSYLDPGNWQMITLVRVDQVHYLYINGVETDRVTDSSGPKNITGSTVYLGWGAGTEYTPQYRGPIYVYNRALTPLEVEHSFEALRSRYGI